ncbi:MAG TPA: hypothetical protein VI094_06465 [Propionibacteriaceae bacterium]
MTSAAVTAATTPLPRPRAIDGVVENDISNRTLIVRRPKHITGYEAFMWRQAHEALVLAEERGWYGSDAAVRCSAPGNPNVVAATPGENLALKFHFPAGTPAGKVYTELVSKPGLTAIVVVDRGTLHFLSVKFLNRP